MRTGTTTGGINPRGLTGLAILAAILVATLTLALPQRSADAELIRLADGTLLHAELVEGQFNDNVVTLRRLDSGGIVTLRWSQLSDEDRMRLRQRIGLELPDFDGRIAATGDRIELLNGTVREGEVTERTENRITIRYMLNDQWMTESYLLTEIADIFEEVQIDASTIKTKDQLYEMVLDRFPPVDDFGHYQLARYCGELGLYEEGLDHIDQIGNRPDMQEALEPLRELFVELIEQDDIRQSIEEAQSLYQDEQFESALLILDAVLGTEDLNERIAELANETLDELEAAAQAILAREWMNEMRRAIARYGADRDLTPGEATQISRPQRTVTSVADFSIDDDEREEPLTVHDRVLYHFYSEYEIPIFAPQRSAEYTPNIDWARFTAEQLFANRDRERSDSIRISLPKVLFDRFNEVQSRGSNGDDGGPSAQEQQMRAQLEAVLRRFADSNPQIRALYRRLQENPEDWEEIMAQARRLLSGAGDPRGSATDNDEDGLAAAWEQAIVPQFQPRQPPQPQQPGANEPEPITNDEFWQTEMSTADRRAYLIYFYCESYDQIDRVDERETATYLEYRYR